MLGFERRGPGEAEPWPRRVLPVAALRGARFGFGAWHAMRRCGEVEGGGDAGSTGKQTELLFICRVSSKQPPKQQKDRYCKNEIHYTNSIKN